MKFEIIGSGGCVALPKPLCKCQICEEARLKGRPYSRYGCSIYLHDLELLIDTPEDICHAINHSSIKEIKKVLFSHMDPDHTLGFRVFEQLRLDWLSISEGNECENPITVLAIPNVMDDLNAIHSVYGSYLDYYEKIRQLINRQIIHKSILMDNIKLTCLPVGRATVFVFEEGNKKIIYAPCDVKPFPEHPIINNADILIIGNTVIGDKLKNEFILEIDNPLREELFTMEEIIELKDKYYINKVILTHLEEDWGKSYDDYKALEKSYNNIQFAYDGMVIEL